MTMIKMVNGEPVEMSPEEEAEFLSTRDPLGVSYKALTARQLRLCLLNNGITPAMVDDQLALMASPAKDVAIIEWEYASSYERDHPLIDQLGAAFNLTTEQINVMWKQAEVI